VKDLVANIKREGSNNLPKALLRYQLIDILRETYSEDAQSDRVHNKVIGGVHKIIYRMKVPENIEETNRLAIETKFDKVFDFINENNLDEREILFLIANRMVFLTATGIKEFGDIFPQKTINFIMPLSFSMSELLEEQGKTQEVDMLTDLINRYKIDVNS